MLTEFLQYLYGVCRFAEGNSLLLAVSGGVDSMVLAHLCHEARLPFAVAHCNFQLRAADSDADAAFVQQWAQARGIPFFTENYDTALLAQQAGVSIQMEARRLRYSFFERLRQQHGYTFVATAHHINDAVETLLINLTKGCGIGGLHGIAPKQGAVLRPLLAFTRQQIDSFAQKQQIAFREDASNAEDKYIRNKIRHQVVPALQHINPQLEHTFAHNFRRFADAEILYRQAIEQYRKKLLQPRGKDIRIPVLLLKKTPAAATVLYELLQPYGFHAAQSTDIIAHLQHSESKQYFSDSHRLVQEPRFLWILAKNTQESERFLIEKKQQWRLQLPDFVMNGKIKTAATTTINTNSRYAFLDAEKIEFPLTLRRWEQGDYFYPFGMKKPKSDKVGKKKLSKYFKDEKWTLLQREQVWILQDAAKRVVWVVGARIDQRFAVHEKSKTILHLYIKHIAEV